MKMGIKRWVRLLLSGRPMYRLSDLMKLSGLDWEAARKSAARLCEEELLIRLGKELFGNGIYPPDPLAVAMMMRQPAYVSLSSALAVHGLIELDDDEVTAVTQGRPGPETRGPFTIHYQRIRDDLFHGFQRHNGIAVATPEKALLDWLHLRPHVNLEEVLEHGLNLETLNSEAMNELAQQFPKATQRRLRKLKRLWKQAER